MAPDYGPIAGGAEVEYDPQSGRVRPDSYSKTEDAPFYCPGCGLRDGYQRECTGRSDAPHRPIEVVSTDELKSDYENHTAAPNTDRR